MSFRSGNLVEKKQTLSLSVYSTDPIDQFLTGQLSDSTRRAYEADLRHFFSFLGFETVDIEAIQGISFREVTAFRNHLSEQGYKRTTINRKLSSLKALFKMERNLTNERAVELLLANKELIKINNKCSQNKLRK